jgi:hypothetical protein
VVHLVLQVAIHKIWSIEKVNAQLPDLNGGVVRLLLQMKKARLAIDFCCAFTLANDAFTITKLHLLLQMMRLLLQISEHKKSSRKAYRSPYKTCNRKRTPEQLHFLKDQFARENAQSSDYHSDHILPLKSFGSIMTLSGSIRAI